MPKNNQSNRGSTNRSRSNNNNPEGYNQYNSGWTDSARERPFATAAAAAAAVGAGVFLWSRRNQITEQLSNLSDQLGEWTENNMGSRSLGSDEFEMAGSDSSFGGSASGFAGNESASGFKGSESSFGGAPSTGSSNEFGSSSLGSTPGSTGSKGSKGSKGGTSGRA